jgi:hypothetical protein
MVIICLLSRLVVTLYNRARSESRITFWSLISRIFLSTLSTRTTAFYFFAIILLYTAKRQVVIIIQIHDVSNKQA